MRYSPLSGSEGSWPNVSSLGYYCTTFPPLSLSLSEGAHWEVNESRSQWGVYTRKMECYFKAKTTVRERDAAEPSSERGLFSRKFSALIQIQPDIHSHPMGPVPLHPRRCFFWGPPLSTRRHAVQKRCPCIAFVVNKVSRYFGSSWSWQHKIRFEMTSFKTSAGSRPTAKTKVHPHRSSVNEGQRRKTNEARWSGEADVLHLWSPVTKAL